MSAVAYRFRSELRSRWRAWLALAMLVGAVAGAALLLFAGSRRTGSAHDRFRSEARAFDVGLLVQCPHASGRADGAASCRAAVARLPAVLAATTVTSLPAYIETLDGRSIQPNPDDPCDSDPGIVEVTYDASGRYGTTINRSRLVAGRSREPRRGRRGRVVSPHREPARAPSGKRARVRLFAGADCGDAPETWRAPQRVRVVGVQLSPAEVRPPSGTFLQTLRITPAFVRRAGAVPDRSDYLVVRLRPSSSIGELRSQANAAGQEIEVALAQADTASAVERGIRPNQVSLEILGALTTLAGVAVLGQILVRQTFVESTDDGVLAALGMRVRERVALAAFRSAAVGLCAASVAIVTAVVCSPIMPIGLAREVEPAPGFSVDGATFAIGGLFTLLFVVAVTAATAGRLALRGDRPVRVKRAAAAGFAAHAGLSPAAVSGVRLALERGAGTSAVPVASSFAGLAMAVAAVVGALTFGAGLTHLQSTPRLIGWNWNVVMTYPQTEGPNAMSLGEARTRAERVFAAKSVVADVVQGTLWSPFPGGRDLQVGSERIDVGGFAAFDGAARLGPSVISGRKPSQSDEIMLGPRTIAALDLHVGDDVDVIGQAGTWDSPGPETSTSMTIVGTGLAPMTESLGRGAVMTIEGLRRLSPNVTAQAWFVRLRPDADRATAIDAYRSAFPRSMRSSIETFGVERFDLGALNLEQIESVPVLFGIIMGLMAISVLAHVLTVASRARRRDVAVLRALGFSRGQTVRTVAWQAVIYAGGGLAIGVPAGLVLGRFAWRSYARHLGAVPEAVLPLRACAAVVVATLVIAAVLAIGPALRLACARPGEVLRAE